MGSVPVNVDGVSPGKRAQALIDGIYGLPNNRYEWGQVKMALT